MTEYTSERRRVMNFNTIFCLKLMDLYRSFKLILKTVRLICGGYFHNERVHNNRVTLIGVCDLQATLEDPVRSEQTTGLQSKLSKY